MSVSTGAMRIALFSGSERKHAGGLGFSQLLSWHSLRSGELLGEERRASRAGGGQLSQLRASLAGGDRWQIFKASSGPVCVLVFNVRGSLALTRTTAKPDPSLPPNISISLQYTWTPLPIKHHSFEKSQSKADPEGIRVHPSEIFPTFPPNRDATRREAERPAEECADLCCRAQTVGPESDSSLLDQQNPIQKRTGEETLSKVEYKDKPVLKTLTGWFETALSVWRTFAPQHKRKEESADRSFCAWVYFS